MAKLHLVCSKTANNFILLDNESDTYAASCAPNGEFDGVDISTNEFRRPEQVVSEIREAINNGSWCTADELAEEIRDVLAESEPFLSEYYGFRRIGNTFAEVQEHNERYEDWKRDVYYEI